MLRTVSDAQFTLETSCNSLRCSLLGNVFQISNCRSNKGNEEGKDLHLFQGHWDGTGKGPASSPTPIWGNRRVAAPYDRSINDNLRLYLNQQRIQCNEYSHNYRLRAMRALRQTHQNCVIPSCKDRSYEQRQHLGA